MLTDSYIGMVKLLREMHNYCQCNKIYINGKKTEVILFQKGGRGHKRKNNPFWYRNKRIDYVSDYSYLGVSFTQSTAFDKACSKIGSKAHAAAAALLCFLYKNKILSWKTLVKLFQALVNSILLYASPIYAIKSLKEIEKIQVRFYKRLLNLPQSNPDYAVRI